MAIIISLFAFVSTMLGGLVSIKYRDRLHLILGFTAGVLLGLVALEIFPEIFKLTQETRLNPELPMIALVVGFLIFHLVEKFLLVHHSQENTYGRHKHPSVGIFSALALVGHSFLDGVGIGLGFQISSTVGLLIAVAVISHDFSDGLNTGSLMLLHKNSLKRTLILVLFDALAPVLGVISTLFFKLPDNFLLIYLGFFAGFLLYIGIADILPEAHSQDPSLKTVAMTVLGVIFIFLITRAI